MSFVSIAFLALLMIVVPLYYILPQKFRWILLLTANCIFYGYYDFSLLILLAFTVLTSYGAALLIERSKSVMEKRIYLIVALVICLGVLIVFKYLNFLLNSGISIANWFGAEIDPIMLDLVLPVGISFYTFQTVAYVIDVYNGIMKAEKHFGYYALFVTFFPQLVAGPIEKAQNLLPQFRQEHKLEFKNFKQGFALMAGGFIKKVVVADLLAQLVNAVYNAPDISSLSGLSVLVATVLFFIQIYCDFSAYSDIAIGCAQLLGIKLMTNFNKPFSSQTVTEFWSRWHVSLTDCFNEYIYLPLTYKTIGKKHLTF